MDNFRALINSDFSRNHQLSPADGPKVVGKVTVAEVFVGHGEIIITDLKTYQTHR